MGTCRVVLILWKRANGGRTQILLDPTVVCNWSGVRFRGFPGVGGKTKWNAVHVLCHYLCHPVVGRQKSPQRTPTRLLPPVFLFLPSTSLPKSISRTDDDDQPAEKESSSVASYLVLSSRTLGSGAAAVARWTTFEMESIEDEWRRRLLLPTASGLSLSLSEEHRPPFSWNLCARTARNSRRADSDWRINIGKEKKKRIIGDVLHGTPPIRPFESYDLFKRGEKKSRKKKVGPFPFYSSAC